MSVENIKREVAGRERDVYIAAGCPPEILNRARRHYRCPLCEGVARFRWLFEYEGAPLCCNHCGKNLDDVFDSVAWLRKYSKDAAVKFVANFCTMTIPATKSKSRAGQSYFDWNHLIAEYNYTDPGGNVVYQNVQSDTKDFRPRRPDPAKPGMWIYNLPAYIERVPYNLPKLLDKNRRKIYIVENEKDADNLNRLLDDCGIIDGVTTTSRDGFVSAKDWPGFIDKHNLAVKQVTVLSEFGCDICEVFLKAGCEDVKLVTLPVKGVSDWIELRRGEGKQPIEIYQELETLCQQAKPVTDETIAQWRGGTPAGELRVPTRTPDTCNTSDTCDKPDDYDESDDCIESDDSIVDKYDEVDSYSYLIELACGEFELHNVRRYLRKSDADDDEEYGFD